MGLGLSTSYQSLTIEKQNEAGNEEVITKKDLQWLVKAVEYFNERKDIKNSFKIDSDQQTQPVTEETKTPSEIRLQILNGSGKTGAASEIQAAIGQKYQFQEIVIGNTNDFDKTIIKVKNGLEDDLSTNLTKILTENGFVNITQETLEETSEFDIIVILGK